MKLKIILSTFAAGIVAVGCGQSSDQSNATASSPAATNSATVTNADNTAINARDRGNTNLTALDQGNTDADIKTSASIRKQVVSSTNNFSTAAQNIKIITQNGKVTLRGPVANDAEKTQIDAIAQGVVGAGNVDDQLEVKANQ